MNKDWIEIIIFINTKLDMRDDPNIDQLIDIISDFIISQLKRGVIVEDDVFLKAYCTPGEAHEFFPELNRFLKDLNARHGNYLEFRLDSRFVKAEDWSDGWKKYFKPIKIGKRLVVKPSWEEYIPNAQEIVIAIDPGQAFGTGTHATTRLCLEFIEEYCQVKDIKSALDCGTGTGILGIALAKLGVAEVLMIDIDPVAVEVARKNVELNRVQHACAVSSTPIWEIEEEFDLVVANLDQNTLLLLAEDLARVVEKGGIMVVSGLIKGQDKTVVEKFDAMGLQLMEDRSDAEDTEWCALAFLRSATKTRSS